jgi:hypothetical protein
MAHITGSRPLGDSTTVLDICDRDEMDDDLFPLAADKSWFTRDKSRRTLNFSPTIQEFVYKGTAEFGQRLVFEIGSVKSCDLLFSVGLQIQLGHWLPENIVAQLATGYYTYQDPNSAWYYANSLGTAIVAKAEFMLDDQVLESADGDFSNMFSLLFSDINTQFGYGVDANGRASVGALATWNPKRVFPTTDGIIVALMPFSFQRIRLRNGFPLLACREGTVRIAITLRPFSECVRQQSGTRATCDETPLGKTFTLQYVTPPSTVNTIQVTASSVIPQFKDCRLVTYGMLVDGKLREAILRAPFERMYREVQTFRFDEAKKYVVNTPSNGVVRLQLPLECNGPVEEILWFIRRKAQSVNNDWTNYSNVTQYQFNNQTTLGGQPLSAPLQSMLVRGAIQVNGITLLEAEGDFFRRDAAKSHRGGTVGYNNFVYGYMVGAFPGRQNPTGWMNTSRSTDVRLRIDVLQPGGSQDLEFEVVVFCMALNWVRYENGIANKLFMS